MDDDPFGSDFGSFEDLMKGIKPGEARPLSGILRYRQGNDPLDWSTAGNSKYIPGTWQMLAGVAKWQGGAATFGGAELSFATAFANGPIVLASPVYTWPLFTDIRCMPAPVSGAELAIYWWTSAKITVAMFSWLAMGPVGP